MGGTPPKNKLICPGPKKYPRSNFFWHWDIRTFCFE